MDKNKSHHKIIRECLNAAVNGPFFPDWEFATLFGLAREEIKQILNQWPDVDINNGLIKTAINSSFNNLTGYPINEEEKWPEFISVSRKKLIKIYTVWRKDSLREI
jgi:hypothetical protein